MNFSENEEKVLQMWEQKKIFQKTLEKPAPKGSFVFYEGPPTANGKPGIHHAESRAFKDCIPRFRTMQGYNVVRKAGWDTHGLPVELEVEKQLGFKSKVEIEEYGIDKFNEKCKESVWAYKEEWEKFTKRLGYWVDLDDPYITYKPEYVESLWAVIKQIWDKDYLYKDYRVTPHCPRCGTSLSSHELSQGYKDVKDLTITAKFKVLTSADGSTADVPTYILAWTTTPWTLPGNVALAVGSDLDYVKVTVQADETVAPEVWIMAEEAWLKQYEPESDIKNWNIISVEKMKGSDLVGTRYEPLYDFLKEIADDEQKERFEKAAYQVHPADFVTTEDGTGIVHTAVMYGHDDFELGNEIGLPKVHMVHLDGTFVEQADFLAGRFVADEQVAIDIIKDLAHRGLLFAKSKYEHSYPHCWRCKTKVIYYAKDSWYIRMTDLRDNLLERNETVNWEPSHIKQGRFGEWLREVKDWAFSRERYWGTPLPIWEAEDGSRLCVGSFEELKSLAKDPTQIGNDFDPHRPFVDDVVLTKDGKDFKRVTDVVDVWFDSGAMPLAQWHYPFENKELVDSGEVYPADYISEAIDQTRGWFYTLLAVATLLDRPAPYKNVICLGHVLDAEGKKMSKSVGNIVEPMEMMNTYGADAVRWYMYSINQPGESKRFDTKMLQDMVRQNFGILMNVANFYVMFEDEHDQKAAVSTEHVLDQWILGRLHGLTKDTTERMEQYVITETVRELGHFITDLSTWYLRRSRDRIKGEDEADKQAALTTLRECLLTFSKLMAPFAPFVSETLYAKVGGEKESVHLEDWPEVDEALIDQEVLDQMGRVRSIVSKALERRADAGINIRQVLGGMTVTLENGTLPEAYQQLVLDEVNVKQMIVRKGEYAVELDLELTPELVREGTVREIVRRVNSMRKKRGLTLDDRIELYVGGDAEVLKAVEEHQEVLIQQTLATAVVTEGDVPADAERFRANEFEIILSF